jgi:hypothetical protein
MSQPRLFLRCRWCSSQLLYPESARYLGGDHWCVLLRCPNCERAEERVLHNAFVEELEHELDRDTEELAAELRRLTRANMVDEVERFVEALDADAILPMDF